MTTRGEGSEMPSPLVLSENRSYPATRRLHIPVFPHLGQVNLRLVRVWRPFMYASMPGTNRSAQYGHS